MRPSLACGGQAEQQSEKSGAESVHVDVLGDTVLCDFFQICVTIRREPGQVKRRQPDFFEDLLPAKKFGKKVRREACKKGPAARLYKA
jgi:hypothetical protein